MVEPTATPGRVISSFEVNLAKQLEMKGLSGHGGQRRGAGRPNLSGLVSHGARARVNFKLPLNLTLHVCEGVPNLRAKSVLKLFRDCCAKAKRLGFHVLHFSIQSNHIHLIVEAKDNEALSRGMQSLAGSFAKKAKALMQTWKGVGKIKGAIFAGRYHLKKITNPTQMCRTLRYVLLNKAKHEGLIAYIDDFSTGRAFTQWKELLKSEYRDVIQRNAASKPYKLEEFGLSPPRSWLAKEGWRRARLA